MHRFLMAAVMVLCASPALAASFDLAWSVATDTGGSGLAGYAVERCTGSGDACPADALSASGSSGGAFASGSPVADTEAAEDEP